MITITDLFPNRGLTMNNISVSYGKVVFPTASAVITAFVVEAPFKRALASQKLARVSQPAYNPAGRLHIEAGFTSHTVQAPDGTIICMQAQRKHHGKSIADGAIFLRIREKAAMLSILAKIPTCATSLLGEEYSVFMGRADILTATDLAALGIEVSDNYVRGFMDREEVSECFYWVTVAREVEKAPRYEVVEAEDGEKVTIQADTRVRRMRVRRS